MKLLQKVKHSIRSDIKWVSENRISFGERARYIVRKYYAFTTRSQAIRYLGNTIQYDNVTTPVTLQSYPDEIFRISEHLNLREPCAVLDVGANVGQFSVTLATLFPTSRIYAFEANPDIFDLLRSNTDTFPNIRTFNLAIAPPAKMTFYYVPGKSAKGSFIKSNAIINLESKNATEVEVESIELSEGLCSKLRIPVEYDLVKVDVEGFELQVLQALKGIKTNYLAMEFSIGRECGYEFFDLLKKIEQIFGHIKLLFCDEINDKSTMGNMLIQCLDFNGEAETAVGPGGRTSTSQIR